MTFREHEVVRLAVDLYRGRGKRKHQIGKRGELGTIVHIHRKGEAFVVEVSRWPDGVDVIDVKPDQLEKINDPQADS